MTYHLEETICAIASAPGGAARGIVRASGQNVLQTIAPCFRPNASFHSSDSFHPNKRQDLAQITTATAIPGEIVIGSQKTELAGRAIPCDLLLWPNERSYTREPVIEIHTIGSPPLLSAIVEELTFHGARPAEPGEFTLRAFLAGRIDLTQAEAVLGVIDARDEEQLHAALKQLAGGIGQPMLVAREQVLSVLAELEAGLDFVEEDIEFITPDLLDQQLAAAEKHVLQTLEQMKHRVESTDLPRVVLLGRPNAGKSSLFNALASTSGEKPQADTPSNENPQQKKTPRITTPRPIQDAVGKAIVSQIAGTTRDYLSARLLVEGLAWELIDTAGIEQADEGETGKESGNKETGSGKIGKKKIDNRKTGSEKPGNGKALAEITDLETPHGTSENQSIHKSAQEKAEAMGHRADVRLLCYDATQPGDERLHETRFNASDAKEILVLTKCDAASIESRKGIATSSQTGEGLDQLLQAIGEAIKSASGNSSGVLGTAARCRESLRGAAKSLAHARHLAQTSAGEELIAAELRFALLELGKVVGVVYTDDVLDRIFSQFCIGK